MAGIIIVGALILRSVAVVLIVREAPLPPRNPGQDGLASRSGGCGFDQRTEQARRHTEPSQRSGPNARVAKW